METHFSVARMARQVDSLYRDVVHQWRSRRSPGQLRNTALARGSQYIERFSAERIAAKMARIRRGTIRNAKNTGTANECRHG